MTILDREPIERSEHDPMPPAWVRRKREPRYLSQVDQDALLQAMKGGVPAEVEAYAPPKSRVVDAGQFAEDMDKLKEAIQLEACIVGRALRKHADEIEKAAEEQCDAIDMAVTDANIRQQAAAQMAQAFARVSSDITGQVNSILARKDDPGATTEVRDGLEASLARVQEEREDGA